MRIEVETSRDEAGVEQLRRFRFDDRAVEVADIIDQWHGANYRYVKVRGGDGAVYILRYHDIWAEWELTMYQRLQPPRAPANAGTATRPT